MRVELGKTYKTHNGRTLRIICVDRKSEDNLPVVALLATDGNEVIVRLTADGLLYGKEIMEVTPYDDWEIDDPIWVVYEDGDEPVARHFAGVTAEGKPMCFPNGRTSHSSVHEEPTVWGWATKTPPQKP